MKVVVKKQLVFILLELYHGISNFYNLVDSVSSEISQLAEQFSNDVNEIQTSGIDLNGNLEKLCFQ